LISGRLQAANATVETRRKQCQDNLIFLGKRKVIVNNVKIALASNSICDCPRHSNPVLY
jgi:hypothetical protein